MSLNWTETFNIIWCKKSNFLQYNSKIRSSQSNHSHAQKQPTPYSEQTFIVTSKTRSNQNVCKTGLVIVVVSMSWWSSYFLLIESKATAAQSHTTKNNSKHTNTNMATNVYEAQLCSLRIRAFSISQFRLCSRWLDYIYIFSVPVRVWSIESTMSLLYGSWFGLPIKVETVLDNQKTCSVYWTATALSLSLYLVLAFSSHTKMGLCCEFVGCWIKKT